jgi:Lon protease-like protein
MSDRAAPLPETVPIFPLTGVLLLPRGRLPLNIFEPRYLAMIKDALAGERLIGMVQPSEPQDDNRGGGRMNPPVYPVGCAGRITAFSEADDGRYLVTLTGVSRFRIRQELPILSGYRRIVPDWQPFVADREPPAEPGFDREHFARALKGYFAQRQISADWEAIEKAPGEHLLTSIAMLCPFEPSEKQALLEAADLQARAQLLVALIEMATIKPSSTEETGGTRH